MTKNFHTASSILFCIVLIMFVGKGSAFAQSFYLTAQQLDIYFGHPKKVSVEDNSGTTVIQFDIQGRITSLSQGNMRIEYDWESDDRSVIVSQFIGQNMQDGGIIEIEEFTKKRYKYNCGETNIIVNFMKNGAVENTEVSSPYMSGTTKCYYHTPNDMYPYAIEQSMGDQSIKVVVTIDKTDSYGNAIEITQEFMGHKMETRRTIEYY